MTLLATLVDTTEDAKDEDSRVEVDKLLETNVLVAGTDEDSTIVLLMTNEEDS